jgi:hypothetical protein
MWDYFARYGDELGHMLNRMDRMQWLLVFGAAVLLGFLCMRGFGSRKQY